MSKNLKDVVFVSALRTPIGKFKGLWKKSQAHELGKIVILNILQQTEIEPVFIDEVIMGQVLTGGNRAKSSEASCYCSRYTC